MDNFYNTNTSESSSMVRNNGGKETNKKKGSFGNRSSKPVKLSTDPQSVAARERRHRISDRFKILQSLVPGGTKMDTVSMLEEAINYVKFLKTQIWLHQTTMMINLIEGGDSSMVGHCNQQCVDDFCSQTNMVGQVVQGPHPFPLGGTCFQVEEEIKPFDMHP